MTSHTRAWLPLPVLLAATVALWLFPLQQSFELRLLIDWVYLVAILPASCYIALLAARSYRATGDAGLVLLGSGTLAWGLSGTGNGILLEHGPNAMLTVHNTFVWLSGVCHVAGVFLFRRPGRPHSGSALAIGAAYAAVAVGFVALLAAAMTDLTPPFFVPGSGGTALREAVLLSALLMFFATGLRLAARSRRGDDFASWYGLALLLIAVGLLGIMLQSAPGTAIGWVGRAAQWIGTGYMVVAALRVTRRHDADGLITLAETERQLAELAAIVESSQDAIIGKNLDGIVTSWNAGAQQIFGYTAEEMVGTFIGRLFPPDRIDEEPRLLAELAQGRRIGSFESVRVRKDGTRVNLSITVSPVRNAEGRVIGAADIARDIGDAIRMEQAQRESEQRLRLALDAAFLLSFEWDIVSNRVYRDVSADPALPARQGAATFEAVREVVHPEDRDLFTANARAAIDAPDGRYESEFRIVHPDGSVAWLYERGRVERDEQGRPLRLIGLSQDVTQRKELMLALEAARDAAEEANRAKSAFLANMSHEIRTPLNVILGMIHLVRKEGLTERQALRLDHVNAAADHLLALINDILDLSKIEAGKLELEDAELSLDAVLDNARSLLAQKAAGKGLRLTITAEPLPYRLRGDATRLTQALLNLGNNAVKFTERGDIDVRVRVLESSDDGLLLRFDVEDSGIGVAPDELARLFMPFEQADRSTTRKYGGTGLGLAIARRIVEAMGGEAGATSTPGLGSDFWFTVRLRRAADDAMPATPEENAAVHDASALVGGRRRVLLVEDDADNRLVMTELLGGMELQVDVASDGVEAVRMAAQGDYDLVLLDIEMPRMDGIEAARCIRDLPGCQSLPIVAVTANAFSADKARCLAAGMNEFVSKPVKPAEFCGIVLKWIATAATANA